MKNLSGNRICSDPVVERSDSVSRGGNQAGQQARVHTNTHTHTGCVKGRGLRAVITHVKL